MPHVLVAETYFASGIKIVAFEFEVNGEQCVSAYASHEAEAILEKLKVLVRKARYLGYI